MHREYGRREQSYKAAARHRENNVKDPDRAQDVKQQTYEMPALRPEAEQVIFNREHHRKERTIVGKWRWKIQSRCGASRSFAKRPHRCHKRFGQVIPRPNVLVLYYLVGIVEDEVSGERISPIGFFIGLAASLVRLISRC